MVPPCAATIDRAIVRPIPRPCDFVVTKGVKSVPIVRGQTWTRVANGDFDVGARDFACYRELPPGRRYRRHRIHGVHDQIYEHLLQEHLIAVDNAGTRQIYVHRDLPRSHVVGDKSKAFRHGRVQIDRLLLQLVTPEHRPVALDDLRRADALGLDIGEDLSDGVRRRTSR